jgi:hypothetical protein
MNTCHLPVHFCIEKDRTLDTMEAVLAIARRGGLTLGKLQLHSRGEDDLAMLELRASDPALLDLFLLRLSNLIGIADITTPE